MNRNSDTLQYHVPIREGLTRVWVLAIVKVDPQGGEWVARRRHIARLARRLWWWSCAGSWRLWPSCNRLFHKRAASTWCAPRRRLRRYTLLQRKRWHRRPRIRCRPLSSARVNKPDEAFQELAVGALQRYAQVDLDADDGHLAPRPNSRVVEHYVETQGP